MEDFTITTDDLFTIRNGIKFGIGFTVGAAFVTAVSKALVPATRAAIETIKAADNLKVGSQD